MKHKKPSRFSLRQTLAAAPIVGMLAGQPAYADTLILPEDSHEVKEGHIYTGIAVGLGVSTEKIKNFVNDSVKEQAKFEHLYDTYKAETFDQYIARLHQDVRRRNSQGEIEHGPDGIMGDLLEADKPETNGNEADVLYFSNELFAQYGLDKERLVAEGIVDNLGQEGASFRLDEDKLAALYEAVERNAENISQNADDITGLHGKVAGLDGRVSNLEGKVDDLWARDSSATSETDSTVSDRLVLAVDSTTAITRYGENVVLGIFGQFEDETETKNYEQGSQGKVLGIGASGKIDFDKAFIKGDANYVTRDGDLTELANETDGDFTSRQLDAQGLVGYHHSFNAFGQNVGVALAGGIGLRDFDIEGTYDIFDFHQRDKLTGPVVEAAVGNDRFSLTGRHSMLSGDKLEENNASGSKTVPFNVDLSEVRGTFNVTDNVGLEGIYRLEGFDEAIERDVRDRDIKSVGGGIHFTSGNFRGGFEYLKHDKVKGMPNHKIDGSEFAIKAGWLFGKGNKRK